MVLWLPRSTSRGTGVDETPPDMVSSSLPQLTLVPAGRAVRSPSPPPPPILCSYHSLFFSFVYLLCLFLSGQLPEGWDLSRSELSPGYIHISWGLFARGLTHSPGSKCHDPSFTEEDTKA